MPTKRRSSTRPFAAQAAELSIAAPQVVVRRLTQLAQAGANPSAADRREFFQMGSEKVVAFSQGWMAMWMEAWKMQFSFWQSLFGTAMTMPFGAIPRRRASPARTARATERVLAAGLAPIHAKAVSNAKRLSRRK